MERRFLLEGVRTSVANMTRKNIELEGSRLLRIRRRVGRYRSKDVFIYSRTRTEGNVIRRATGRILDQEIPLLLETPALD